MKNHWKNEFILKNERVYFPGTKLFLPTRTAELPQSASHSRFYKVIKFGPVFFTRWTISKENPGAIGHTVDEMVGGTFVVCHRPSSALT